MRSCFIKKELSTITSVLSQTTTTTEVRARGDVPSIKRDLEGDVPKKPKEEPELDKVAQGA